MARDMDFIGFTFNGRHSSEFNIYSVSDGSRYQDNLVPNPIDYTEQVPGGVGQYYFGSDMDIKEFPLSIAYDNLSEIQVRELRNWLAPESIGELVFDERPYKEYTGKISSSPNLSFICFEDINKETGKKERVYKGEGQINFICYYPLATVEGKKKELKWYRDQINETSYRTLPNNQVVNYQIDKEVAVVDSLKGNTYQDNFTIRKKTGEVIDSLLEAKFDSSLYKLGAIGTTHQDNYYVREKINSIVTLEDKVNNSDLFKCAAVGETTEIGSGDKGPENPYTIAGAEPTTLTACGRNLLENQAISKTINGVTFTVNADKSITVNGTATAQANFYFYPVGAAPARSLNNGAACFLSGCPAGGSSTTYFLRASDVTTASRDDVGDGITCEIEAKQFYIRIQQGTSCNNLTFRPQLELGYTATPYEPYTGQTVSLPVLAPLYGDGTVNDEYDAVTGVETRRWRRLELKGTETYNRGQSTSSQHYYFTTPLTTRAITGTSWGQSVDLASSHFIPTLSSSVSARVMTNNYGQEILIFPDFTVDTVEDWKAWLAAQYAAGTPVTVVYQLANPIITKIGNPTSIELLPDYNNILTDSGLVGANYKVITESHINTDILSPTPDYPAEITGDKATKVTLCGKNLLDLSTPRYRASYSIGCPTISNLTPLEEDNFPLTVNGDSVGYAYVIPCKPSTQYKISVQTEDSTQAVGLAQYKSIDLALKRENALSFVSVSDKTSSVLTSTEEGGILVCMIASKWIEPTTEQHIFTGKELIQVEIGTQATFYQEYSGKEYPIPLSAPLYGDSSVYDEYDVATGIETRRRKRLVLDGTEGWYVNAPWNTSAPDYYHMWTRLPNWLQGQTTTVTSHFPVDHRTYPSSLSAETSFASPNDNVLYLFIHKDRLTSYDTAGCISWLAAQYAAGTPVTVVYQLANPIVTLNSKTLIRIDKANFYKNVFSDIGRSIVEYTPTNGSSIGDFSAPVTEAPSPLYGSTPTYITCCGEQLYNPNDYIEIAPDNEGYFNISMDNTSGTVTQYIHVNTNKTYRLEPNRYYTFVGEVYNSGNNFTISFVDNQSEGKKGQFNSNFYLKDISTGVYYQSLQTRSNFKDCITVSRTIVYVNPGQNINMKFRISILKGEYDPSSYQYKRYEEHIQYNRPDIGELQGKSSVYDEYNTIDAIKTEKWGKMSFNGTENWVAGATGITGKSRMTLYIPDSLPSPAQSVASEIFCSHYKTVTPSNTWESIQGITINNGDSHVLVLFDDKFSDGNSVKFKQYLANEAAAGTPVTIVYRLQNPKITQLNIPQTLPLEDESSQVLDIKEKLNTGSLIVNSNPDFINYYSDSTANLSLRIYPPKYPNIDEWALSTGMLEDLKTTGLSSGYDHYITLPDGAGHGFQLYNPGDRETDFILTFNKPTPMNDILFTLSDGQQFMLNLRSSDTDVDKYGAVSDDEKRVATTPGGIITIDTKKNRIMYKHGSGSNIIEESIYFALKEGQFFKIPKNKTATGGYNLAIGTTSNIEKDSIKISYDYLYY